MANYFAVNSVFCNFTGWFVSFVCFKLPAIGSLYLKNLTCQLWASCFITLYWLNVIERLSLFLLLYTSVSSTSNSSHSSSMILFHPWDPAWFHNSPRQDHRPFFCSPVSLSWYCAKPFTYSIMLWGCYFFCCVGFFCFVLFFSHQTLLR